MKKGPIILVAVGICIALVVSMGSFKWLKAKAQAQVNIQETVDVAVASVDVPWGTVLNKQMIKFMPFLKTSLPAGYHTNIGTLEGRVAIYPLTQNTPIFESSLAPKDIRTGGMAAVVAPKKRAMAVKVDKVIGVSGFVFPGNRVDVLVTLSEKKENQPAVTKIVLQNILVLATGSEVEKTGKQEKPSTVDVITLEVTPGEGEKLALAGTEGKLQLALRNFVDTGDAVTRGATLPSLVGPSGTSAETKTAVHKADPGPARQSPRPSQTITVELIRGAKLTPVKFSKGD